jgi:uncharacterized damage-inducible protein DinB
MQEQLLTACLGHKIKGSVERTNHLIGLVPSDRLDWCPSAQQGQGIGIFTLGELLGHLADCVAGFCAALLATFPAELADFSNLRQVCTVAVHAPEETRERIAVLSRCIERGFGACTDSALSRKVVTVFAPEGEALLGILLGNFEHLTNHKHQLFLYLRLLGLPIGTEDLYYLPASNAQKPSG